MDDRETLKKFKIELKAQFPFVPDPDGKLVGLFDVKMPVLSMAQRYSFVIGEDRKIMKVQSGSDAVNPAEAIAACPVKKKSKS
jgi:thioredoxin-dependent peroxiredoxin